MACVPAAAPGSRRLNTTEACVPQRHLSTISRSQARAPLGIGLAEDSDGSDFALRMAGPLDDALAPQQALRALVSNSAAAEALLATLADDAIESMLTGQPPSAQAPREPAEDDFGPPLTPAEAAALADDDAPASAPASPAIVAIAEPGNDLIIAAMPTDEELAALLREDESDPPLSEAAAAVAAELDEDRPMRTPQREEIPRLAPRLGAVASLHEDHDADAIQAEGAIEARGSVNLIEPAAPEHEPMSLALSPALPNTGLPPAVTRVRPLEPFLPTRPSPPARTSQPPRQSWWLAPLLWLNAPLRGTPHSLRESIGKLALLTLLNAVAVLVYALVIRR